MALLSWEFLHLALTGVWAGLITPTLLWWRESVLWVALMSLWANVASHFAAWQTASAERHLREYSEVGREREPNRLRPAGAPTVPMSRRMRDQLATRRSLGQER